MKRFFIILFAAVSMNTAMNAQTNDLVTVLLNPAESVDSANAERVITGNDDLVLLDADARENGKGRNRSFSKSVSTSNGKTVSTVSSAVSGGEGVKSVESLAVFELFGDKYKRAKGCTLTVIDNKARKFRSLEVSDNAEIVNEIKRLISIDKKKATNITETYTANSDNIIMNFGDISVGFDDYINKNGCNIFISW